MENRWGYERLADAMGSARVNLVGAWIRAYGESAMRLPGKIEADEVRSVVEHVFSSLANVFAASPRDPRAAPPRPTLIAGSPELREVEQAAAFLGGNLASTSRTGFDVAALLLSLRDVLLPLVEGDARVELGAFVEWLAVVAADSFGAARARAVHEEYRDLLEDGTPLVHIVPELPAVLLVGATDVGILDSILSRLLLAVVRVGAKAVLIDVASVADPTTDWFLERLSRFLKHRKIEDNAQALVTGLAAKHRPVWQGLASSIRFFDHFDAAVAEGLRLTGFRIVHTSTACD